MGLDWIVNRRKAKPGLEDRTDRAIDAPAQRPSDGYRKLAAVVEEIREWDVILLGGDVKLIGMASTHLPNCCPEPHGATCKCLSSPRLTSPVVDAWTRPLRDSRHSGDPVTGAARPLLTLDAGDEVTVLSGKSYRLAGPRRVQGYDGFASGSIFRVYAEQDIPRKPSTPWWLRVMGIMVRRPRSALP